VKIWFKGYHFASGEDIQEKKKTSHSHTKRSFSGISISRWAAVANVCAHMGSNVRVTT
jgi:hypothetical protein